MNLRHHLVFVTPNSPFRVDSCHQNNQELVHCVMGWINKGLPCIFARQLIKDDLTLTLGLPIILNNNKYRVRIFLNKNVIQKQEQLPKLIDMAHFLAPKFCDNRIPFFTREELTEFQSISVYGSYLFEYLSNKPFVNHNSDLDLLIEYDHFSLSELNNRIIKLKKMFRITIDGEVRFNNLGDIAIKELTNASANQLMFKNTHDIGLITRHDLYEQYPDLYRL